MIQRGFSISAPDLKSFVADFSFCPICFKNLYVRETQTSFALQGLMLEFYFEFIMVQQIGSIWMHHHGNREFRLGHVVPGWWTIAEAGKVIYQNLIRNRLKRRLS